MDKITTNDLIRNKAIQYALAAVGQLETSPNYIANGRYHAAAGILQGEPYCMAGIIWAYNLAATTIRRPPVLPPEPNCQAMTDLARARNWIITPASSATPGDICIWHHAKRSGHAELCVDADAETITTVSWNSPTHGYPRREGVVTRKHNRNTLQYTIRPLQDNQ